MRTDGMVNLQGQGALWLVREAAEQAESLVDELVVQAVDLWRAESFTSCDSHENSLSVRLYAFCRRVLQKEEERFALVHVHWEAPEPTRRMLDGFDPPCKSPRPDFTLVIGRRDLKLEAKRLDGTASLYKEYVVNGMARYWDGRYPAPTHLGFMFAYLQGPTADDAVAGINKQLTRVRAFSVTDLPRLKKCKREFLIPQDVLAHDLFLSCSRDQQGLVLRHFALTLPTSPARTRK